jgi:arylsulfatase A-like enzyme
MYVHTMEPHNPYRACDELPRYFRGKYRGHLGREFTERDQRRYNKLAHVSEEDRRYIRALYYCEVTTHYRRLGRFLRELAELGVLETTLLVHTSDHGEELFDHGKVDHGWSVYEEVVRSPLAIRFPPLFPAGKVVDEVVEHVDLVPTIIEALGLPGPAGLEGTSLRAAIHGRYGLVPGYAVCENYQRAVRVASYKLCHRENGFEELFDLSRDPGEKHNVFWTHPVARRACELHLGEGRGVLPKRLRLSSTLASGQRLVFTKGVLDAGLRKRLEALGYFNR